MTFRAFPTFAASGLPLGPAKNAANRCSSLLQSHWAFKKIVKACIKATWRSNSLFKQASKPLGAQNHCSSLLQSHFVFKIAMQNHIQHHYIRNHIQNHFSKLHHFFKLYFLQLHTCRKATYADVVCRFPSVFLMHRELFLRVLFFCMLNKTSTCKKRDHHGDQHDEARSPGVPGILSVLA